jgi:hypothetical protein
MSLNVSEQECNGGKKYGQKGTLCGPNNVRDLEDKILGASETLVSDAYTGCLCIGCIYIEVYTRWLCIG